MDAIEQLARAVQSSVFQSLRNAANDPKREDHWRRHADKLEIKFTNQHGRHYSHFIPYSKFATTGATHGR